MPRQPARPALQRARLAARRARTYRDMHEAGHEAYVTGVAIDECPLQPHQAFYEAWLAGWRAADMAVEVDLSEVPW